MLLGRFQLLAELGVEALEQMHPLLTPCLDLIELFFHLGCEAWIHEVELTLHKPSDHQGAERSRAKRSPG